MDWDWLVPRAKVDDLQNRLGFIVTLARELAQKREDEQSEAALFEQEQRLARSLLSREDTLCQESMGDAERSWLSNHRPVDAARWHMLTSMTTGDLSVRGEKLRTGAVATRKNYEVVCASSRSRNRRSASFVTSASARR